MVLELTPKKQFVPRDDCHVAGLLLAAGASKRAGANNKLLYLRGRSDSNASMLMSSAQALLSAELKTVVAVTSETDSPISLLLQPLGYGIVINHESKQGMGSSLKLGLDHLQHAEAVLVCLADMPDIKQSTLKLILQCWQESSRHQYIVPIYEGKRGNPVVIPKCFYSHFAQHNADVGARVLMEQNPEQVLTCKVDDPGVLIDYDTPEQLTKAGWTAPSINL